MSKPDWKDAPYWAGWLAQDWSGRWYWYETRPRSYSIRWGRGDEFMLASYGPGLTNEKWRESLERRP